ncbi:MAG: hypothetical protein ACAI44_36565 [Candidatus Sericytochromatia bacterium]
MFKPNRPRGRFTFDPRSFGDPVALQVAWTPAVKGGSNIRTRKLKVVNSERMVFKPTLTVLFFALLFLGIGTAMLAFAIMALVLSQGNVNGAVGLVLMLGLFSFLGGGVLWYKMTERIVFDKSRGYYWKGGSRKETLDDLTDYAPLRQIHALQLISEYCEGSSSMDDDWSDRHRNFYYSYELNLVLHNAERVNIVDHGSYPGLRRDAETLADFLGIAIWDVTGLGELGPA